MHTSNAALVLAAQQGDREAFALLFGRHRSLLLAVCSRALGDPLLAEDIVQDAAVQALLGLGSLRQPGRFGAWLAGIGLNLCRRRRRESTRDAWSWEALQGGGRVREPVDHRDDPADCAEAAELRASVRHAVAALPDGQRSAVLAFYLSGLSYAETAALLGVTVGAVRTRLHKARRTLQRDLWSMWQEETMSEKAGRAQAMDQEAMNDEAGKAATDTEAPAGMVAMRIKNVWEVPPKEPDPSGKPGWSGRHVVMLEAPGGDRGFPIWVGPHEATTMAMLLEKAQVPRPLTTAFMASVLEAAGGRLQDVRITRIAGDTFYAAATVAGPAGVRAVDARPSDAINLALATGAPIYADNAILEAHETIRQRHADEEHATPPSREGWRDAAAIVAGVMQNWSACASRATGSEEKS